MAITNVSQRVDRKKYDEGFDRAFGKKESDIEDVMDKMRTINAIAINANPDLFPMDEDEAKRILSESEEA